MKIIDAFRKLEAAALEFPIPDQAVGIIELMRRSDVNAEFFFSKLKDQRWIEHLRGRGFFENIPDKRVSEDGSVSHPHSPALAALARLTPSVQRTAAAIYARIDPKDNIAVGDQVLRGLAEINDPDLIPGLVPVVCRFLSPSSQSTWIWLESILKAWLEVGAINSLVEILATILDLSLGAKQGGAHESWHVSEIDREIIAPLAQQQPSELMKCVFLALCRWGAAERRQEQDERRATPPADEDFVDPNCDLPNTYWLESFKTGSRFGPDPEEILAHRLFRIGAQAFESADEEARSNFDNLLRSDRWQLFQRLRWQLYADYPEKSLDFARKDTLERIPMMGLGRCFHNYEFAQMLEALSQAYGEVFLNPENVDAFVHEVLSGPTPAGEATADPDRRDHFHRTQLHPIRSLLVGNGLAAYERLSQGKRELRQPDYKPLSSGIGGTVQFVAPKRANEMHNMSDEELWTFLNTWEPSSRFPDPDNWLVEEDASALGFKFTEYLEAHPERFRPEARWWENLRRPSILHKPLERATERIAKKAKEGDPQPQPPSECDWRNCFGIASWITEQTPIVPPNLDEAQKNKPHEHLDWNWPRIVVVKFLTTALDSIFQFPEDLRPEIGRLLRKLVQDEDPRLTGKNLPWMDDWLNTAINSVRGTALEGLLDLAHSQKKATQAAGPEPWIFEVIEGCLRRPDQSPAVFAILGARTGLFFHLFGDRLGDATALLLPPDRHDSVAAFILAHYHYHNAMPAILKSLPTLPTAALDCLFELGEQNEDQRRARRDYGSRLGVHLGFYYWNNAYRSQDEAEAILDRYFEIAKPSSRGVTIGQIARIFETAPPIQEHAELYKRAMSLWDRRVGHIVEQIHSGRQSAGDFAPELGEFTDWLACECFPFDWRYERVMQALELLEKSPRAYPLVETLARVAGSAEHLHAVMNILHLLISKAGDELRWSYREERLKPILRRGLTSADPATKRLAETIQEILLRHGCFDYLDVDSGVVGE